MKILILSNTPNSFSVKKLKSEADKRKHSVYIIDPLDFVPYVSATTSGHDAMFLKDADSGHIHRMYGKDFHVVIPRFSGAAAFAYGQALLYHFSVNMGIPSTSEGLGLQIASNKFLSHQAFSSMKVRTIPTLYINQPVDFQFITKKLGLPLVVKTPLGSQGSGVFILTDELSVSTTLSAFSRINKNLLLQKFINTGEPKSDIRAYVVDGEVVAAYRRWAVDKDFRSNYSLSHSGEKIQLTEEEKEMAVNAAESVGLPGVCGVDICRDSENDDRPYIIEANGNASLSGVTKISGVNVAGKIIDYAEKIGKKEPVSRNTQQAEPENNSFTYNYGSYIPPAR